MTTRPRDDLVRRPDGAPRCGWVMGGASRDGEPDPLYLAYHDREWGVPERDPRVLFELLVLEGFQAGLSWITVLRKREAFRRALDGFDPERVAAYDAAKLAALAANPALIRNRAKIAALPATARAVLDMEAEGGLSSVAWRFVNNRPVANAWRTLDAVPAQTEASRALAADFAARGVRFFGPTIAYAFMQAAGLVNDHLVGCHRHAACAALR